MEAKKSYKKIGIFVSIAVVIVVLLVTAISNFGTDGDETAALSDQGTSAPLESTNPNPVSDVPADTTKPSAILYKDGTYSATGAYMSPGGQDHVTVSLTLKDDIVTSATVTAVGDNTSRRYQSMFISSYTPYVVGKDVSTLKLSKVSGSSLTSMGFNAAVEQIKAQAKA